MRQIYHSANLLQKQELIRMVFDNSLFYQDKVYRTPYLIPELAHNELKMKEKGLLILIKKGDSREKIPLGGGGRTKFESFLDGSPKIHFNALSLNKPCNLIFLRFPKIFQYPIFICYN
jgi:hypothetical protein